MTLEELRALLLRPEAVRRLVWVLSGTREMGGTIEALGPWADEAARTLAQALVGEQDERDFVIGLLGDWTHEHGAALCPRGADTYGEGMRDAKQQVARILARLGEAVPSAERDAAVRALLDVSTRCVQESDAHQREYAAAADAVRKHFPEGKP